MIQSTDPAATTVGVLALQGAFDEHLQLLGQATDTFAAARAWKFTEVRTISELEACDALIIPGGESTTISLVAQRSGMLDPLRRFVKVKRRPVWGTCAGLILLAESANRTKKGGQDLIGGLDVRVNRNHFGRQVESFEADLHLPFLRDLYPSGSSTDDTSGLGAVPPFRTVFIRAPIVEQILKSDEHSAQQRPEPGMDDPDVVMAPSGAALESSSNQPTYAVGPVEVLARLPPQAGSLSCSTEVRRNVGAGGDIVAVRQGNVFGTAFHPELTRDARIHEWWLREVDEHVQKHRDAKKTHVQS